MKQLARIFLLFVGFFLLAMGLSLLVKANLGTPPWDVFHLSLVAITGFTHGQILQGIGLLLLILSWVMGVKPGIGTVLNMYFVGLFVDLINFSGMVPFLTAGPVYLQALFFACGTMAMGLGTALYIKTELGTGPRDSMMMALSLRVPWGLGAIRTAMEVTVALVGFLLGGPLGWGTVLFALSIGYAMEAGFRLIGFIEKKFSLLEAASEAAPESSNTQLK